MEKKYLFKCLPDREKLTRTFCGCAFEFYGFRVEFTHQLGNASKFEGNSLEFCEWFEFDTNLRRELEFDRAAVPFWRSLAVIEK
jgi:hypothetical protein